MTVIDCFMLNDEVDLLECRLRLLEDVVDHFVVVEGDRTFTGAPKPSSFTPARDRIAPWLDRITHVVAPLAASASSPWRREEEQRRSMHAALVELGLEPDALVLVGDVDELPRPDLIRLLAAELRKPTRLVMRHALYYGNWFLPDAWWNSTVAARRRHFDETILLERFGLPHRFDTTRYRDLQLRDAGWHLSFTGGIEAVRRKLSAYSHQETNLAAFRNGPHLERCFEYGVELSGRRLLTKVFYSALEPELKEMADRIPALFRFEPSPRAPLAKAYRGFAWLRYRGLIPRSISNCMDRQSAVAKALALPAFMLADSLLSVRRRIRPDRTGEWACPVRYGVAELRAIHAS